MSAKAVESPLPDDPATGGQLRGAAVGALWGWAAARVIVQHSFQPPVAIAAAILGAVLGWWRPRSPVLTHPLAAGAAATAALLATRWPEPAFFVLVPLMAAAVSWSLGPPSSERPVPAWTLPLTAIVAGTVFFVQSALRHWEFGSGSKDLGLFYQTHWLIAHGLAPANTVMGMHALADHMELLDYLVAPALWLYDGAETLLFVQAAAAASAVLPLGWLGERMLGDRRSALVLAWAWVLAPDLHLGVLFDYNPTVLEAAGLLWTAWAAVCRGPVAFVVLGLVTCLAKENACIHVAVLVAVLAFRGVPWRRSLVVAVLAMALLVVEMKVLFPRFREGGFRHWEFEDLAESPTEMAQLTLRQPHRILLTLVDHPQKRRSLLEPLAAVGYVGLADPLTLLLQAPNWGERFLSSHRTRWWGYHYGTTAAATAVLGLALGWRRLQQSGRTRYLPAYVVTSALIVGIFPPYHTPGGNFRSDLYEVRQPYVSSPEDVRTERHAVSFVGRDPALKVAAQYHLLPHLAGRPFVVMLDRAEEADVVALQLDGGTWPEGRPAWRRRVRQLWSSAAFHVAFCEGQSVILRRGAGPAIPCPSWEALLGSYAGEASAQPVAGTPR